MSDQKTMTLNLSAREMEVVEELATEQDLTKTQVIRQALRLYQKVVVRAKQGETFSFSGDRKRAAIFIGIGATLPDLAPNPSQERAE